jgi:hypothetical protein
MLVAVVLATSILAWPDAARAEPTTVDKENARAFWLEGVKRREQKDLQGSLRSFRAAHAIMGLLATGLEVAKAEEALGLLVEARDTALKVAKMPISGPEDERARDEAHKLFEQLGSRIPAIVIAVKGVKADTKIRIEVDDSELPEAAVGLPRRINPGSHVVTAQARGYRAARQVVTVAESSTVPVELTLEALAGVSTTAMPADSARKPSEPDFWSSPAAERLGWIGLGASAASLLVGVVAGGLAIEKHADLTLKCPSATCPPEHGGDVRAYETLALSSTIGILTGTALAVGGIGLLYAHDTKTSRGVSVHIFPGAPGQSVKGAHLMASF